MGWKWVKIFECGNVLYLEEIQDLEKRMHYE